MNAQILYYQGEPPVSHQILLSVSYTPLCPTLHGLPFWKMPWKISPKFDLTLSATWQLCVRRSCRYSKPLIHWDSSAQAGPINGNCFTELGRPVGPMYQWGLSGITTNSDRHFSDTLFFLRKPKRGLKKWNPFFQISRLLANAKSH